MIYKIRVILNAEEDAIRDIALNSTATLEDLHNVITNAFGFTGEEMASFYRSGEEWEQGEEFPLFDMGEGAQPKIPMADMDLNRVLLKDHDKMIYIYDYFNLWTFYVELIDSDFDHSDLELPYLLFSLGNIPSKAPEVQFESDMLEDEEFDSDIFKELDDDFESYGFN